MSITAAIKEGVSKKEKHPAKKPKKISWETFQKEYLTREDNYKYEWLDGMVEKTKRTMDYSQVYILINIRKFFKKYKEKYDIGGHLVSEVDTFFKMHHRRPDIAYLTEEQISKGKQGTPPVPQFVIEVISKNDKIRKVNKKMEDYRNANVQVVWQIFPDLKQVHVNIGKETKIYKGEETVSAAPALPDFEMKVANIFK